MGWVGWGGGWKRGGLVVESDGVRVMEIDIDWRAEFENQIEG